MIFSDRNLIFLNCVLARNEVIESKIYWWKNMLLSTKVLKDFSLSKKLIILRSADKSRDDYLLSDKCRKQIIDDVMYMCKMITDIFHIKLDLTELNCRWLKFQLKQAQLFIVFDINHHLIFKIVMHVHLFSSKSWTLTLLWILVNDNIFNHWIAVDIKDSVMNDVTLKFLFFNWYH